MTAFKFMTDNKMYKEMVVYWATDYAGAMFTYLPTDTKIFAVASSAYSEAQTNAYCKPDDIVDGKEIGACLSTEFGTTWLQSSYGKDLATISVSGQAEILKAKVKGSTVKLFGDTSFSSAPVGAFQGVLDDTPTPASLDFVDFFKNNQDAAGTAAQYVLSTTKANIIAAKSAKAKEEPTSEEFTQAEWLQ